jgi:hypothetical protein
MAAVLLVVGNSAAMTAPAVAMKAHLESRGHAVSVINDEVAVPVNVSAYHLIILGTDVSQVGTKYRNVAVPVMAGTREDWGELVQSMMLRLYINAGTGATVTIANPAHPLAGGLAAGQHTIYTAGGVTGVTRLQHAMAPAGMQRPVTNGSDQTVIFGYEAGVAMHGGVVAAARRVGFGIYEFERLNAAGLALFDAAVEWARTKVPPLAGFTVAIDERTVTCTSEASDPDGVVALVEYDFGDGTGVTAAAAHTYASYGAYTITQRVTDHDGLQATDTFEVSLGNLGRATPDEYDLWASGQFVPHLDVLIERLDGGVPMLQSYRSFGGRNWIRSLRFQPAQVDAGIGSGTLTLHRSRGGDNLAPLVIGSPLNQDGGDFAPALDFGREIRILTACMPTDARITTAAPAAMLAEAVSVEPLDRAVAAGSVVHFPTGIAYTTVDAAAGAVLLEVEPLAAAVAAGVEAPVSHEPGEGDWRAVFEGLTDDPEWGGRDRGTVEVPFRDRSGALADTYARDATVYGTEEGDPLGTPLLDVSQAIADQWMGAGQYPTAVRPSPPEFRITRYEVNEVSVWEALERLADQAGAVIRQEWNEAAGEERLTLITPPREKVDPDFAVMPSTYLEVHNISTGSKNLRTIVRVLATDRETGEELTFQMPAEANVAADPLVLQYGPRFLQIPEEEGSAIDTQAELDAYGAAIYADVSSPPIPLEMETRYCWFAAPDQVVRWMPNTVLFDQHLDSAVLGLTHEFPSPGVGRTRWRGAGSPKGAWDGHMRKGSRIAGRNARLPRVAGYYNLTDVKLIAAQATATHVALGWVAGAGVTMVRGAALMFQSGAPNSDEAKNALINAAAAVTAPLMIPKASRSPQFSLAMVQAGWVSPAGVVQWGQRWWVPYLPPPVFAPTILDLDVDGQKVKAIGQNAGSWTITRLEAPVGSEYTATRDGASVTFDLAGVMGASDVWSVEVRAYNDPETERDADSLSTAQMRVVRGPTAPTEAVLTDLVLTAPAVGDDDLTIAVSTTSAPTYTLLVDVRWSLGSDLPVEWVEGVATTPALGAPNGGTQTVVLDTAHERSGSNADGSEMTVNYEVRIRVDHGGSTVDSTARVRSWYIASEAPL